MDRRGFDQVVVIQNERKGPRGGGEIFDQRVGDGKFGSQPLFFQNREGGNAKRWIDGLKRGDEEGEKRERVVVRGVERYPGNRNVRPGDPL